MLALIAGRGALPSAVAATRDAPPLVCALAGNMPDTLVPDLTFRLETLGSFIAALRSRGVTELCLCGGITRPQIDPSAIDAATRPLVPRITEALGQGDDGALRVVIALFEAHGFAILAAHEAAPDLLMPRGVPTTTHPPDIAAAEALIGDRVLAELGAADQGQACVIRGTEVLAREDARGTDAMLADLARNPAAKAAQSVARTAAISRSADWPADRPVSGAGCLFKGPKPGQDRRADLPAIGPETVRRVAAAGLSGIVIEAGGVLVLDQPTTLARAEEAGLYLWSRRRPD
ncbi:LpxI family protein [Roseivivax sp. CAU 1753]